MQERREAFERWLDSKQDEYKDIYKKKKEKKNKLLSVV
jgi:hypothetical protein